MTSINTFFLNLYVGKTMTFLKGNKHDIKLERICFMLMTKYFGCTLVVVKSLDDFLILVPEPRAILNERTYCVVPSVFYFNVINALLLCASIFML